MLRHQSYGHIITTIRTADELARFHGAASAEEFAESLPSNIEVLDVGAGDSALGHDVAGRRPDIHWTNLDFSYHDPLALNRLQSRAPQNLQFVAGDATRLQEQFEPGRFDTVLSYWLLPHLSVDDRWLTIEGMAYVAKTGGLISAGPTLNEPISLSLLDPDIQSRTVQIVKPSPNEAGLSERLADMAVRTQIPPRARRWFLAYHHAATTVIGTNRREQRDPQTGALLTYDADHDTYVPKTSLRGRTIRLAVGARAVRNFTLNRSD